MATSNKATETTEPKTDPEEKFDWGIEDRDGVKWSKTMGGPVTPFGEIIDEGTPALKEGGEALEPVLDKDGKAVRFGVALDPKAPDAPTKENAEAEPTAQNDTPAKKKPSEVTPNEPAQPHGG